LKYARKVRAAAYAARTPVEIEEMAERRREAAAAATWAAMLADETPVVPGSTRRERSYG
jgi:hypothetical protein